MNGNAPERGLKGKRGFTKLGIRNEELKTEDNNVEMGKGEGNNSEELEVRS